MQEAQDSALWPSGNPLSSAVYLVAERRMSQGVAKPPVMQKLPMSLVQMLCTLSLELTIANEVQQQLLGLGKCCRLSKTSSDTAAVCELIHYHSATQAEYSYAALAGKCCGSPTVGLQT